MAITTLSYEPPVRRSTYRPNLDYDLLEAAGTLHDEGRPVESLMKVFEHFFPGMNLPDLRTETFSFTQGSSKVSTRIEGDDISISVPLVRLAEGGKAIAALRFILTKISSTGQLYQPRLRGDDVYLEYRDRLSRLHPAKVLEVLRRMPVEADDNDDFLIGQFGALPLERAPIDDLTDEEVARCEKIWRSHWSEVEELLKECRRKQSMFFLNEMTAYAQHRLSFALPIGGFLASRLEEASDTFNNCHEDPLKREAALAKCVKDMKAVSTEELKKSLGHATYAISPHDDGTPRVLGQYFGDCDYFETIQSFRESGKSFEAALALISTYNFLLSRYSWATEIETALKAGLALASGKPWKEAASLLYEHAAELAEEYPDDSDDEEDDDDDDGNDADEDEEEDGDDSDDDDGEDGDDEGDGDGQ